MLDSKITLLTTYLIIAIVTTPLLLISIYFLIHWEADLLGKKLTIFFKGGFWAAQFIIMALLFIMLITFIGAKNAGAFSPYLKALGYSINCMFLLSYLLLLFGAKTVENKARQKLSRNLGFVYLGVFSLQYALTDLIRLPFYNDLILNNMFMFGMLFLLNGIPLLHLYFFLKKHHSALGIILSDVNRIERSLIDYGLTDREKEIIELIISGMSNKDIGRKLFISIKTVKNHISSIYLKTSVKNRVQLSNLIRGQESSG